MLILQPAPLSVCSTNRVFCRPAIHSVQAHAWGNGVAPNIATHRGLTRRCHGFREPGCQDRRLCLRRPGADEATGKLRVRTRCAKAAAIASRRSPRHWHCHGRAPAPEGHEAEPVVAWMVRRIGKNDPVPPGQHHGHVGGGQPVPSIGLPLRPDQDPSCPSSNALRRLGRLANGVSGPSDCDVRRRVAGGSSGAAGWCVA